MKNLILILIFLVSLTTFAQAPEKMSYQAVIRGTDDALIVNQSVGMQISILQGSPNGAAVYVETQAPTTNANGLATLEIGTGNIQQGDFTTIDWANGTYYLKTETDVTGGNNYDISGTSQLLSSPYALYAKTSGSSIPGPQGPAGQDGLDGEDGNGIESTVDNGDGTFTLNYTDGSSFTTIDLTGPEGPEGPAGDGTVLIDTDGDTQIQVEKIADEDIIRFDLAGTERWIMRESRLEPTNTGLSLFIGENAGISDDLSNNQNIFIGFEAGTSNVTGNNNVAVGNEALASNSSGGFNTAVGFQSLFSNTTGESNVAFGNSTLTSNTTGFSNTAIGDNALNKNETGSFNTAVGINSLKKNIDGTKNTATGAYSLNDNISGESNNAFGQNALNKNTTGSNNVAVGNKSLFDNLTGDNNIAIGNNALFSNIVSNNIAIGNEALFENTTGLKNIAIGHYALSEGAENSNNIAIGYQTLKTNFNGIRNTALGNDVLRDNNSGSDNVAIGDAAMLLNFTGSDNVSIGAGSLLKSDGNNNTAIGRRALNNLIVGHNNTSIGINSLGLLQNGDNNIGIGKSANVPNNNGSNQIRIGNTDIVYAGVQVAWSITSDRFWKENIQELSYGLDFVKQLKPVDYTRKNNIDKTREIGFIAQDIEVLLNKVNYTNQGIITTGSNGRLSVRYNDFIPILTKAIQEQQEEIEILKEKAAKVDDLQNQINELKAMILENN